MAQAVVPTSEDPELQDLDGNFLEGLARYSAEALWENTNEAPEAAYWFFKSGTHKPTSFPNLCHAFGVDPNVIRREVMKELHRRHVARIQLRAPRWKKTADWYSEQDEGAFPFDWFLATISTSKHDLVNEVLHAIANPTEVDLSEDLDSLAWAA